MKINFILNGEDVMGSGDPHETLFHFLRREFSLFAQHSPCQKGLCGRCHVTLDGKPIPSCLTPLFMVRGREIVTPEGFKQTEDYKKIFRSLEDSGLVPCSQCTETQIFSLHSFLEANPLANEAEVRQVISEVPCRCGTKESLVKGILRYLGQKEAGRAKRR